MAMPKKRMSHARSSRRRSHLAKTPKLVNACSNCKAPKLPHIVCANCGYYRGRQVLTTKQNTATAA